MLDRDNAGAAASLEALKKLAATVTDPAQKREVEQAIRSIELRVGPMPSVADSIRAGDPAPAAGQTKPATVSTGGAAKGVPPSAPAMADAAGTVSVPDDPGAAYTDAVRDALLDAMLSYSQQLAIGAEEWLTVAARDAQQPSRHGRGPRRRHDDLPAREGERPEGAP